MLRAQLRARAALVARAPAALARALPFRALGVPMSRALHAPASTAPQFRGVAAARRAAPTALGWARPPRRELSLGSFFSKFKEELSKELEKNAEEQRRRQQQEAEPSASGAEPKSEPQAAHSAPEAAASAAEAAAAPEAAEAEPKAEKAEKAEEPPVDPEAAAAAAAAAAAEAAKPRGLAAWRLALFEALGLQSAAGAAAEADEGGAAAEAPRNPLQRRVNLGGQEARKPKPRSRRKEEEEEEVKAEDEFAEEEADEESAEQRAKRAEEERKRQEEEERQSQSRSIVHSIFDGKGAWEQLRMRLQDTPLVQSMAGIGRDLSETELAQRAARAGGRVRDNVSDRVQQAQEVWETSQNPMIYSLSSTWDRVTAETQEALVVKELRRLQPDFDLSVWVREVSEQFVPVLLTALLRGDKRTLRQLTNEALFNKLEHEVMAREASGLIFDPNLLDVDQGVIVGMQHEDAVVGESPIVVLQVPVQQINCVRNREGEIVEGGETEVRNNFYVFAFKREYDEKTAEIKWVAVDLLLAHSMATL